MAALWFLMAATRRGARTRTGGLLQR